MAELIRMKIFHNLLVVFYFEVGKIENIGEERASRTRAERGCGRNFGDRAKLL